MAKELLEPEIGQEPVKPASKEERDKEYRRYVDEIHGRLDAETETRDQEIEQVNGIQRLLLQRRDFIGKEKLPDEEELWAWLKGRSENLGVELKVKQDGEGLIVPAK